MKRNTQTSAPRTSLGSQQESDNETDEVTNTAAPLVPFNSPTSYDSNSPVAAMQFPIGAFQQEVPESFQRVDDVQTTDGTTDAPDHATPNGQNSSLTNVEFSPVPRPLTTTRSRFFPDGRPVPDLVARGYRSRTVPGQAATANAVAQRSSGQSNQAAPVFSQGRTATANTAVVQPSSGQGSQAGLSSSQPQQSRSYSQSASVQMRAAVPRNNYGLQPQRVPSRDIRQNAAGPVPGPAPPAANAPRQLHTTRPADSWVTDLSSWRTGNNSQQPQQRQQQQQPQPNQPNQQPQQQTQQPPQLHQHQHQHQHQQQYQPIRAPTATNTVPQYTVNPHFAQNFQGYQQPAANFPASANITRPAAPPVFPTHAAPPGYPAPAAAPGFSAPVAGPPGFQGPGQALVGGGGDGNRPTRRPFRPMHAKLDPDAYKRDLTEEEKEYRQRNGISNNYQGASDNPHNISANIPDNENCSLFLTNLPPTCTYKDLLSKVAEFQPGRVWSSNIVPPDTKANNNQSSHRTCAAKIIFYRAVDASRLLGIINSGAVQIKGYKIRAVRNRVKTAEQPASSAHTSRCILITGPEQIVEETNLLSLFHKYFDFETEEVLQIYETPFRRQLEWRFASFRAQAGSAKQLLDSKAEYQGFLDVKYTRDPCGPVYY